MYVSFAVVVIVVVGVVGGGVCVDLPVWSHSEFLSAVSSSIGHRCLLQLGHYILDVTNYTDHPGGYHYFKAYHGKDVTEAFTGGINLHTRAAATLARHYRVAILDKEKQ